MKRNHRFFQIIVGLTALALASVAAYFSVFGLSKLFVASFTVVLFSILELGKIVAVSYLHNYWKNIQWLKKTYMLFGIIIMMSITSLGIYGYLSAAYDSTSNQLNVIDQEVILIENKKKVFQIQIDNINSQIEFKEKRINQLVDLRTQQESRLDSLISNRYWYNVDATRTDIETANVDIKQLDSDIVDYHNQTAILNDSIGKYDIQIIQMKNNEFAADLGPLKQLSTAFNITMDKLVNYLIFAIIIIFDPMAIALLLAFNDIVFIRKKEDEDEENNDKEKDKKKDIIDKTKDKIIDNNEEMTIPEVFWEPNMDDNIIAEESPTKIEESTTEPTILTTQTTIVDDISQIVVDDDNVIDDNDDNDDNIDITPIIDPIKKDIIKDKVSTKKKSKRRRKIIFKKN